ncbi:Protein translocase subunit SecF [Candidatus Terasakiella magnetica]|uniref:Protein-export membrane protein SecF n=1 Tax=Candidatus Terasakiella magnetica TaxID=1867952 RepID=A0A1C3RCJ7_9PROT|nr:protein translocase subunit SecF [Candidatus Terasakiella magnetica]SCA54942.1 Protein translocase subunit SecF [Candidatus Terasakiella magnetica]
MKHLHLVPAGTKFDFVGKKLMFFAFSVALILASLGLFGTKGLNYGIDFKGGIMMEIRSKSGPADIGALRDQLGGLGLGEVAIQEFGEPEEVLIRIQRQDGDEKAQQTAVEAVKDVLKDSVEYRRTEFVGPKVSEELFMDGVMAVTFAIGAILIYIWFRFEWQFGMGAVIALIHDVISTIGIFALLGMEFNLSTVAAILTIAGYSINDTVVVYDRVRENLRKYKKMDLAELLNKSVNETLSRTVMTSVTTLLALLALYILGGEVIRGFSFAMIWGILIGTYSSICLAVPILTYFSIRRSDDEDEENSEIEKVEGEGAV